MKRYYFRNNEIDFVKWCRLVPKSKMIVKQYRKISYEMRVATKMEYEKALLRVKQYEVLLSSLDSTEKNYLEKYLIHSTLPPWTKYNIVFMNIFKSWQGHLIL